MFFLHTAQCWIPDLLIGSSFNMELLLFYNSQSKQVIVFIPLWMWGVFNFSIHQNSFPTQNTFEYGVYQSHISWKIAQGSVTFNKLTHLAKPTRYPQSWHLPLPVIPQHGLEPIGNDGQRTRVLRFRQGACPGTSPLEVEPSLHLGSTPAQTSPDHTPQGVEKCERKRKYLGLTRHSEMILVAEAVHVRAAALLTHLPNMC